MGCASSAEEEQEKYGHALRPSELEILYEKAWHDFDTDQSGYLDRRECKRVLVSPRPHAPVPTVIYIWVPGSFRQD